MRLAFATLMAVVLLSTSVAFQGWTATPRRVVHLQSSLPGFDFNGDRDLREDLDDLRPTEEDEMMEIAALAGLVSDEELAEHNRQNAHKRERMLQDRAEKINQANAAAKNKAQTELPSESKDSIIRASPMEKGWE